MAHRDPIARAEYQRKYRASDKGKAARRRELDDPRQKEIRKEAQKRFYSTEIGKKAHSVSTNKYLKTPAGIESRIRLINSEKFKQNRQKRHLRRMGQDPQYAISFSLRSRLKSAIKGQYKTGSAIKDLGCSIEQFIHYCQNHPNWQACWTWADLGKLFQLDHIKPLGLFDLTKPDQFKIAVNYTNLQPLSIFEHKTKTAIDLQLIEAAKKRYTPE